MIIRLIGYALIATLALSSVTVQAGECVLTNRKEQAFTPDASAKTTVKNRLENQSLLVEIRRNDSTKVNEWITSGSDISFKGATGGNTGTVRFHISLYPADSKKSAYCSYTVWNSQSTTGDVLRWDVPDDQTEICPTQAIVSIACEKSWHKDKTQYHTVLTVSDLS